jgi:hypothetical protein
MLKSATHEPNGKATPTVSPTSSRPTIQKTYAEAVSSTPPKPRKPAPAPRLVASARATERADVDLRSTSKISSQNSAARNGGTGTTRIEDGSSSAPSRPAVSAAKTLPQKSIKDEAIGPRHDGPDWKVVQRTSRTSRVSDPSSRGVPEQDTSKAATKRKHKASKHSKETATKDVKPGASKMQQTRTQDKLMTSDPLKDKGNGSLLVSPKAETVDTALPDKKVSPKNPAATSTNSTRQGPGPDQKHGGSKPNDNVPNSPERVTVNKKLPDKKASPKNSTITFSNSTRQGPDLDQEYGGFKPNDSISDSLEGVTVNQKLPDKKAFPKNLTTTSSNSTRQDPNPDQKHNGSKPNDSVPDSPEGVTVNKKLPDKKAFPKNSATTSSNSTRQNLNSDQKHGSSKANDSLPAKPEIDTTDTERPDQSPSPKDPAAISPDTPRLGPDQEHAGLLQGLTDFVRNLVLEEVRKDSNTRKTSPVDEPSALVPAAPADRPAIVDQTTQTDAEKKDRRDRLKDKYRERRRLKRQKEREQQSQQKWQQKLQQKLQQKSSRPSAKLNPMAKIFLPASAPETGLAPFSGSLLTT